MDNKDIYKAYVAAGMTPAGACSVMGNQRAESVMRSNNVEDRCNISDEDYTKMVDKGGYDFATDNGKQYGYGLSQWTYHTRKTALLNYAKSLGVSVGDKPMQVQFTIKELKSDFPSLWKYLCTTNSLEEATSKVCKQYERPAVNNIKDRVKFANEFYSQYAKLEVKKEEVKVTAKAKSVSITTRQLSRGMTGEDVRALQLLLMGRGFDVGPGKDDADFGPGTQAGVDAAQEFYGLTVDSIAGHDTWTALING